MSTAYNLRNTKKEWKKVNAELTAAQPLVSTEMKMRIGLVLKCTTRTIETYLAGQGKKLPFAKSLLVEVKAETKGIKEAA